MTIDTQKNGVVSLVAEKVMQHVYAKRFAGVEKTISEEGDNTIVLEDVVIGGDVSGTMTVSGTLTATAVETQTGVTMDFGGDITVVADEFTTTQTITTEEAGEVTYTVTLDGTWTMVFDGSVVVVVDGGGNLQSFNMDFTVTANSQAPLSVVGFGSDDSAFTGTVDINSLTVSLDYSGEGDMTPQCSGSISATIEGETGTQTCVIKSDCSDCQ